ncbi:MAG: sulfatase [Kiritimatiellales bacterium]
MMKEFVRPKNIIWITTDHQRFDCLAAHGNPEIITPNMDRLVENGVSFTNAIVQNPVCMPSRCSFMTGQYPQQVGITWNGGCLPDNYEPSVARLFSGIGYQTTQIGKLHFQPHEDNDLDPRPRNRYGFDIFYGAEEPGCYEDAYRTWLATEYPQYKDVLRIERSSSLNRPRLNNPVGNYEGKVVDAPWQASFSGWIAQMACNFLDQRHRRHKYQFMHLGFYAPHPPLNPTREMFEPYRNRELSVPVFSEQERMGSRLSNQLWDEKRLTVYKRHFYAMVTGVDFAIGQLLEKLEATGELNDTLIILNSDHGDACGDHFELEKYYDLFYDGVVRVPLVFHWPNGIKQKGQRISSLVELVDILPTVMELCGCPPADTLMGRSYASELRDGSVPEGRATALTYSHDGEGPHVMLTTPSHKYFLSKGSEVLWAVDKEGVDIAGDFPETLEKLRFQLLQRLAEAGRSYRPHHQLF